MKKLTYRMYGFVPYNLSPIQAGIQHGHAVVEFGEKYRDQCYKDWAKNDKTFIILDGGTTNNSKPSTMSDIAKELKNNKIKHVLFFEPDLNDALTGIALLADSRTDRKVTPGPFDRDPNPVLAKIELIEPSKRFDGIMGSFDLKRYKEWVKFVGGPANVFLRYYLPKFRLANN